jgi:hypothetical protein
MTSQRALAFDRYLLDPEIRRALDDDPRVPRVIETAHRRGYRFIAPVAPLTNS